MGHLLVVESWVGAMGTLLPRAIREAGHTFTFVTRDPQHYLREPRPDGRPHPLFGAANVVTAETNDPDALIERVERLHSVLRFDGVLTSCDYYLPVVARIAERLGLPGPAPAAVERACRKDLTRTTLHEAGLPGPRFAVAEGWPEVLRASEAVGFPLVVKPVDLCAGMFVRKVADENQLQSAFAELAKFPVNARQQPRSPLVLLEQVLDGPEVSVETVTYEGVTHVVGVTDKSLVADPWFVESGHMFPADLSPSETQGLGEAATAALRALGLDHGVAHSEFRLTAAGPRLIEVNPRPAGNRITELIRRVTGIDLPMACARLALGEKPDLAPLETGVRSAAIAFRVPDRAGTVTAVRGLPELADEPDVVDVYAKASGHRSVAAQNNNDYLAHVMVVDRMGPGARRRADALVAGLVVDYAAPATPEAAA